MIRKKIIIKTIDDILKPEEIEDYHREWNKFLSLKGMTFEKCKNVVKKSGHVMIGKAWQYKDYPVTRAAVLRRSWIPYDPPQPIWNPKQDYIEVIEQMGHAGRKIIAHNSGCRYFGRGKDPEIHGYMFKAIPIGQRISIEAIFLEKHRKFIKGREKIIGGAFFTFYNTKNEAIARYCETIVWSLRDYETLFAELQEGKENVQEELIRRIRSQERKLKQYERTPRISSSELVRQIREGPFDDTLYEKLEDFFSLYESPGQNL